MWSEKNHLASAAWKLTGEDEKQLLKSSSDDLKSVKISSLSEEQKSKLILQHRKKLLEEVTFLIASHTNLIYFYLVPPFDK
jgi:hypothetical protein